MAVPGHDTRDFEFAQKFGLEVRQVVAAADGDNSGNGATSSSSSSNGEGLPFCDEGVAVASSSSSSGLDISGTPTAAAKDKVGGLFGLLGAMRGLQCSSSLSR